MVGLLAAAADVAVARSWHDCTWLAGGCSGHVVETSLLEPVRRPCSSFIATIGHAHHTHIAADHVAVLLRILQFDAVDQRRITHPGTTAGTAFVPTHAAICRVGHQVDTAATAIRESRRTAPGVRRGRSRRVGRGRGRVDVIARRGGPHLASGIGTRGDLVGNTDPGRTDESTKALTHMTLTIQRAGSAVLPVIGFARHSRKRNEQTENPVKNAESPHE